MIIFTLGVGSINPIVIDGIGYVPLAKGGWLSIVLSRFAFLLIGVIIKATFPETI